MKYAAIDSMRQSNPLGILCDVLSVSTSGYHEWKDRQACARQLSHQKLLREIRVLHAHSFGAYNSPRIHQSQAARPRDRPGTNSSFDA